MLFLRKWWMPFLLLLLAAVLVPPLAVSARPAAQEEDPSPDPSGLTMQAEAGFDGIARQNAWLPVTVNVANNGPALEGELRVIVSGSGTDELIYSSPLALPTQSDKQVTTFVFLPAFFGRDLLVQLVDEQGQLVAERETAPLLTLNRDARLFAVVSEEPRDLDFLENVSGSRSRAAVAYLGLDQVPENAAALNPVDVLIFTNVDSGRLSAAQLNAITQWVSTGGQLVITGGLTGAPTTAGFADLLPVTLSGSRPVDDLPELRQMAGVAFRDPGPYVLSEAGLANGEALLLHEQTPVLARQSRGNGTVTFLGLDPGVAPLLDWAGNETFWATVVADEAPLPPWANGPQNNYAAANAVTSLPSLGLPSVLLLVCFLGIYILIIGPVNYLILKRAQRRELAWLTIPALVLFFCGLSYVTGVIFAGNEVTVNQVATVFGQAGSEEGRVTSLLALYSPQRNRYDLALPGDTLVRPFDRDQGNMAGFGNLDAVARANEVTLQGVQVDVSGVETFVADSYRPLPDITGQAHLRLDGSRNELDLTLQNNSDLTLEDAGLFIGMTYIPLGDLEPGALVERTEALTASQIGGSSSSFVPGGGNFLERHLPAILGTSDYYNDPDVYARWQLLDALNNYEQGNLAAIPAGTVTLLAWTAEPQLETTLDRNNVEQLATTAYFIELPLNQTIAAAERFQLPVELLSWQVLGENGVYEQGILDFYMPPGWIEYEFTPWPEFAGMTVETLAVVLNESVGSGSGVPGIRLWDWNEATWITQNGISWGTTPIADYGRFVSPANQVRLRLENDTGSGLNIAEFYPQLSGRFTAR